MAVNKCNLCCTLYCGTSIFLGAVCYIPWVQFCLGFYATLISQSVAEMRIYNASHAAADSKLGEQPVANFLFHFYNYTNLDEIKGGAIPVVNEIGPYTLAARFQKYNITFNADNTAVTYRTFLKLDPADDATAAPLTDSIVTPYTLYNAMLHSMGKTASEQQIASLFGIPIQELQNAIQAGSGGVGGMFCKRTAQELMIMPAGGVDAVMEIVGLPKPHLGILAGRGVNDTWEAEVEFGGKAQPSTPGFPHCPESRVYTGLSDPDLYFATHKVMLPAFDSSAPVLTTFWNSSHVLDGVPTIPVYPSAALDTAFDTNFPYGTVTWLSPRVTDESELVLYEEGNYRSKTFVHLQTFRLMPIVFSHLFLKRFVVKETYWQVNSEFFNDRMGMFHMKALGAGGLYIYNKHMCGTQQERLESQMTEHVQVLGYPSCNFSVDGVYMDIYPTFAVPLVFNAPFEVGQNVFITEDGSYRKAAGHENLGTRFLPSYNLQVVPVSAMSQLEIAHMLEALENLNLFVPGARFYFPAVTVMFIVAPLACTYSKWHK